MKNILIISMVYITTVIGAGFASGQEIVSFFIKYGNISLIGAVLVSVLLGTALFALLVRCRRSNITDFSGYLSFCAGKRWAKFFDFLITAFMLCVFGTMTSCAAAVISDIAGIGGKYSALLVCALCFVCFCFDLNGLALVNTALSPVIIAGITGICVYILFFRETAVFSPAVRHITDNFAVSALGYTSYNLLTAAVIAVDMSMLIKSEKDAAAAGKISAFFFFVMLILLWTVIKIYYGKIDLGDVPMLTITSHESRTARIIYICILLSSVFTTAVSSGFGSIRRISAVVPLNKYLCIALVCISGFMISGLGFSNLVEKVYRICGTAGIALLVIIIKDYIKIKKDTKSYENKRKIKIS